MAVKTKSIKAKNNYNVTFYGYIVILSLWAFRGGY